MKHDHPQFKLRLPPNLKEQLEAAAVGNSQTLTSEIVSRLQESLTRAPDDSTQLLTAELAKSKRDAAYAAYISERWLVSLVMLWDIYLDVTAAIDALGMQEAIPEYWRQTAEIIGNEADDEFKRHLEDYDPIALHDSLVSNEQQYQKALAGVVQMIAKAPSPPETDAKAVAELRKRILRRSRREYLPVDTSADYIAGEAAKKAEATKPPPAPGSPETAAPRKSRMRFPKRTPPPPSDE